MELAVTACGRPAAGSGTSVWEVARVYRSRYCLPCNGMSQPEGHDAQNPYVTRHQPTRERTWDDHSLPQIFFRIDSGIKLSGLVEGLIQDILILQPSRTALSSSG